MIFIDLFPKTISITDNLLSDDEHYSVIKFIQNYDVNSYLKDIEENKKTAFDFLEKDKSLITLKNKILQKFSNYFFKIYENNNTDFKITTSWLKALKPNHSYDLHNHRNAMYSCSYYLTTQNEGAGGNIVFVNTNTDSFYILNENKIDKNEFFVKPVKNRLIIFPSFLYHKVQKNLDFITRYSINCNLMPLKKIGEFDSSYYFN